MNPSTADVSEFFARVQRRLAAGANEYADRPADQRSPAELLTEALQELEDCAAWSMLLWLRMRRIGSACGSVPSQ